MKRREIVVDMVKAAFIVLTVKVMASTSALMPWNSMIDNLCIIFAVGVMLAKVCMLTLTLGKLLVLGVVSLLVLYTCAAMGQYDLMVTLVAVCLLIDEDIDAYISLQLKTQTWILVLHIAIALFLSLTGKDHLYWITTGSRIRFSGGFSHPNVLSSYILSCMLMFAWKHFKQITGNEFGWMITIVILSYAMTRSRTGLLLSAMLLLLVACTQNENPVAQRLIGPVLLWSFPVLTLLMYWARGLYLNGNGMILQIDELMTGRIKYAAYAYVRSGISWLPRYLDYAEHGHVGWTPEWNLNTFTFDSLYSFFFIQMGMIWIGVVSVLNAIVCRKATFKVKIFMLVWVLFAIVEVHGLNCFKFFPLILLSTLISRKGADADAQ